MLTRMFASVGQGAFYIEKFNNGTNIVYDCGSTTGISYVKREIKSFFYEGEDIEALFISHLHEDHINGIPYLMEYCNVKNVFFPLIRDEDKILLNIQEEILKTENKDVSDLINNPYTFIDNLSSETKVYLVEESRENEFDNNKDVNVYELGGDIKKPKKYKKTYRFASSRT